MSMNRFWRACAVIAAGLMPMLASAAVSQAQMKKISTFLSNFTELHMFDITADDFKDPANAIRFGIWHNYVNNFKARIVPCGGACSKFGDSMIDRTYVSESVKRYTGIDFSDHQSVRSEYISAVYDGRNYQFAAADGEMRPYAKALSAKEHDSVITVKGILYNPDDPAENVGEFTAEITPYVFNGRNTWRLLSLYLGEEAD